VGGGGEGHVLCPKSTKHGSAPDPADSPKGQRTQQDSRPAPHLPPGSFGHLRQRQKQPRHKAGVREAHGGKATPGEPQRPRPRSLARHPSSGSEELTWQVLRLETPPSLAYQRGLVLSLLRGNKRRKGRERKGKAWGPRQPRPLTRIASPAPPAVGAEPQGPTSAIARRSRPQQRRSYSRARRRQALREMGREAPRDPGGGRGSGREAGSAGAPPPPRARAEAPARPPTQKPRPFPGAWSLAPPPLALPSCSLRREFRSGRALPSLPLSAPPTLNSGRPRGPGEALPVAGPPVAVPRQVGSLRGSPCGFCWAGRGGR